MKRAKKKLNIEKGDLVYAEWCGKKLCGLVVGNDKDWYVLNDHFDICKCMVDRNSIKKIIKKNVVPKKYMRFVKG